MEDEGTTTTRPLAQSFIIKRPRLTKLLDESEARIILLVAPAGYGKTTLAREWLGERKSTVAWHSASATSADVVSLAIGIASELDSAFGGDGHPIGDRLSRLTSVQQRPEALARIVAESRKTWPARLIIAIDDYHQIARSTEAEAFVSAFVSLVPAVFVITSRSRPRWIEPRQTIYGEAVEIGIADLQMTDEETREVLTQSSRRDSVRSISRLARGWPAVIGLAARARRIDFPESLPGELYGFLADDLIASASEPVQDVLTLLATAGIKDIDAVEDLLGGGAQAAVDKAASLGLVTCTESGRITIHPLLAEFLISRWPRSSGRLSTRVNDLVRSLIDTRRWDECLAVAEALPTVDVPIVVMLELSLEEFLEGGRVATLSRWLELARGKQIDAPIVDLADGEVALRKGDYERALTFGERAAERLVSPELLSRAQLLCARAAHLDDQRAVASAWFERAEEDAPSQAVRNVAVFGQFLSQWEQETGDLAQALRRVEMSSDGSPAHELRVAQCRSFAALAGGTIHEALRASQAAQVLLVLLSDPLTRLSSLNHHAWALVWAAKYHDARIAADRALTEADESGIEFVASHALVAKVNALIGLRMFAAASEGIGRLEGRIRKEPDSWLAANIVLARARLQLSLGDLDRAADELVFDLDSKQAPEIWAEYYATRGLVDASRGSPAEAERWLGLCAARSTHVGPYAISVMTRAILASNGQKPAQANEQFSLALRTGHHDAIVMGCRACPTIAPELVKHTPNQQTLRSIFRDSADVTLAAMAGLTIPRAARRSGDLSPRELEVYELIVQGRTNREISRALFIAESTTKVHVRHILEKLGVRSRVDAVRAWRLDSGS
jgi:ATP/maltotriose-dependent transcriptional regulator MalT